MKDLDFDEIDRAVSSVMSNDSSDDVKTEPAKATPASTPVEVEPKSVPAPGATSPAAARRSVGHFMDVVHPSSDMRRSTVAIPERHASAPTLPPVQAPMTPPIQLQPAAEAPVEPEPTKVDNTTPTPSEPTVDSYDDADIDKISDEINKELGQKTDSALESPFISGTKVEKRPLGAFSGDTVPEKAEDVDPKKDETDFAPNPVAEKPFSSSDTPLPAELSSDLLQIEADSTTSPEDSAVQEDTDAETNEPAGKVEDNKPLEKEAITLADEPPKPTIPELTMPTGPTAVKQLSDDKSALGDRDSGAIYDTNSYHKALVHPIKTKPRLMWVLYVAILLVVGAGVGAAVFVFAIPFINSL